MSIEKFKELRLTQKSLDVLVDFYELFSKNKEVLGVNVEEKTIDAAMKLVMGEELQRLIMYDFIDRHSTRLVGDGYMKHKPDECNLPYVDTDRLLSMWSDFVSIHISKRDMPPLQMLLEEGFITPNVDELIWHKVLIATNSPIFNVEHIRSIKWEILEMLTEANIEEFMYDGNFDNEKSHDCIVTSLMYNYTG